MGGDNSKENTSKKSTGSVSKKTNDSSQKSSLYNDIRRLAIDQSAVIGSLYDARQDCILKEPSLQMSSKLQPLEESPQCTVKNINEYQGQSLSNVIDIDKDLYLSVRLNMTPTGELSSIFKYSLTTNAPIQILYYYYISEEKYVLDEQNTRKLNVLETIQDATATHFVSGIKSGILAVVILELSPKYDSRLDVILQKIASQLVESIFNLTADEERLLDQLTSTKIFSNLSVLSKFTKLSALYREITKIKSNMSQHRLLEYSLRPIKTLISFDPPKNYEYFPLATDTINQIERHLTQISLIMESLKTSFTPNMKNLVDNFLKNQFDEVQQQISNTQNAYQSRIEEIRNSVHKMRSGASQEQTTVEMHIDEYEKSLQDKILAINDKHTIFQEKLQLIENFKEEIEYWNVNQLVEENNHDLEIIRQELMKKSKPKQKRVFCFDDRLAKPYSSQWNEFYSKLMDEHKTNSQSKLVYADFSFCSCQLPRMEILSSKDAGNQQKSSSNKNTSTAASSSSKVSPISLKPPSSTSKSPSTTSELVPPASKKMRLDQSNKPTIKFKNILLLGESGVGKSTFINALVNYLTFENLEQARSGEPIVLMPVSFLLTVGDDFQERIVRFGGEDPNEDHNQSGQSVTQYCRSYVFTIGTQTKIRLIDTPGMGDTRGLDQDDRNMQHILSYINNLSHLDAICILLKPNEARLNVVLRSYFTRLLGFLGENVRNNIIFCFTNTRATFFAPGNTGPLLKKMLESHTIKDIPFKKANTFCFDNESFRYLVARLNGIEFDNYQKEEYKQSWISSVNESNRLLQCICDELKSYPRQDWQSIEHAHFHISQLIWPMLETIRNTMRTAILLEKNLSKSLIKLDPMPVHGNSSVCLDCKRPERFDKFWIAPDKLHILSNQCNNCQCDLLRHAKVNYLLTYKISVDKQNPSATEIKANLNQLKQMITDFIYIFKDVIHISKENHPILSALNQMIDEEKDICSKKGRNILNSNLHDELEKLKNQCEKLSTAPASNRKPMSLPDIYKIIQKVSKTDTIREQMDAIKETQKIYMAEQEIYV